MASSGFTYPELDHDFEKDYLLTLIRYLQSKREDDFVKLLQNSDCHIITSKIYAQKINRSMRWDAFSVEVHFHVAADKLDIVKEEKDREKLRNYCDEILESSFGYDITQVKIVPKIARRLEGTSPVPIPEPKITSAVVERAIGDAEALIKTSGAISGVDRVHTALHGYLRAVCDRENISYSDDHSMTRLFKLLRQHHPALQNLGTRSQDIERVLQSFASIMDALNPIRNNASVAHPNPDLLGKDEAMLVINAARTLLHYLDAKFG